jgi:hypothetical protein
MPSRSVTLVIVAFWLGTTFWLLKREIIPRFESGLPPRFAFALTDDSDIVADITKTRIREMGLTEGTKAKLRETRWTVRRVSGTDEENALTFTATTTVVHYDRQKEDEFDLVALLDTARGKPALDTELFRLGRLETAYQVRRDPISRYGTMLGLKVSVSFRTGALAPVLGDQKGEVVGEAKDDVCRLRWKRRNNQERASGELEVPLTEGEMIFLPQHPLERMRGLWAGRRWGMYLLDPTDRAASAEPRLVWVLAEVREDMEELAWSGQDRRCRVIDYAGDHGDIKGSIWVDVENDRVLRMMARLHDETWNITRE